MLAIDPTLRASRHATLLQSDRQDTISMYTEERRRQIASMTAVQGRVGVTDLAMHFGVTAETIRRDLTQLDHEGILHRVHGGAVPRQVFHTNEISLDDRQQSSVNAKRSIAEAAADFFPGHGGSLLLDAGTSTGTLTTTIAERSTDMNWSIITNSVPAAISLANSQTPGVQLLGGTVRSITQATVGETTMRSLALLRVDVAFIGTNAISIEHGLSTADPTEAAVKRAMVANSRKTVVLADSTKFGRDFLVSFASLRDIDVLVTDSQAPEAFLHTLRDHGIQVVVA